MLYRFWRMTRHSVTVVILSLFSATAFAGYIGTCGRNLCKRFFLRARRRDSLCHNLAYSRHDCGLLASPYRSSGAFIDVKAEDQSAKSLLRRLMTSAISTGSSTSLIAIVAVFAYFHEPASNVAISVTFILGRVYSCTMLYLLNNRSKMRGEMADGTTGESPELLQTLTESPSSPAIFADDPAASAHAVPEIERKDEPFSGLVDVNDPDALRLSISTWTTISSRSGRSSTSSEGGSPRLRQKDSHVSIQDDTPPETIP
ncbi:hypothetical protein B0H16DRAFT_1735440 [Mycena metata]|uniref:DUF6534 domain-containing protein n=1 Tax=Mycena metata TaxID=1033252 RepID=A0AAD7HTE8_9AGAR|nr:hypothetical protein B0H16DRAFT_1735440 [Mycena metata]